MKRRPRQPKLGMHPVLKAQLRAAWEGKAVEGQIHALLGGDKDRLLAYGALLLFVAAACALRLRMTGDEPDMRIVRASVNALDDLKGRTAITDQDRASLHAGMLAAHRVIKACPIEVVVEAAQMYDQHSQEWERASA